MGVSGHQAAAAAPVRARLDIRKPTVTETLIELGVRMGVTVGGVEACKGPGVPLIGTFELRQALDQATAGKGCVYAFVDAQTIRFAPARVVPPRRRCSSERPASPRPNPSRPWLR